MNADVAELDPDAIPSPREASELFGHEAAEKVLVDAHASGRLPHAWLISGPAGIGKATLAFRFARYLFNNPPGGDDPAGGLFAAEDIPATNAESLFVDPSLPVFHRVAAGGHADLFTLERTVNDNGKLSAQIRVDDVRAAIHFAHMTPSENGFKVIIVDGAEVMNRSSENAFLKVLEEPPPDTIILIVSHTPGQLLPTTRSRCRSLALKPLPTEIVARLLARHAGGLSEADAAEIARLSDGSIGRALMLAAGDGLSVYREMVAILASLPALDGTAVQTLAKKLARPGADHTYRSGIELFRWWLSRIVLAASRGVEGDRLLNDDERAIAARAASTAILPVWLGRLDEAESLIRSADALNLDKKQVVLSLFLSLA